MAGGVVDTKFFLLERQVDVEFFQNFPFVLYRNNKQKCDICPIKTQRKINKLMTSNTVPVMILDANYAYMSFKFEQYILGCLHFLIWMKWTS